MKRSVLFTATALVLCNLLSATDWYIDPVNGSDFNPGTAASPWRTVNWALEQAGDGDRIFCGPGVYSPSSNGDFLDPFTSAPAQWIIGDPNPGIPQRLELIGAGAHLCTADPEHDFGGGVNFNARVLFTAAGTKISGFTFTNPLQPRGRWSMFWRLGSTTPEYTVQDVEIFNCVFDQCPYAYVSFGESFGTKFHDNVVINGRDGIAATNFGAAGGDLGFVYNNTFMNHTNAAIESLIDLGTGASQVYIWNNIFLGITNNAIWYDTAYGTPTIYSDFNNFWANGGPYGSGLLAGANDTFVDPQVVSATDWHLQPTSPLIDAGTTRPRATIPIPATVSVYPPFGLDVDKEQRFIDSDYDGVLGIEKGADEYAALQVTGQGPYALGAPVVLTLTDQISRFANPPSFYLLFLSAIEAQPELPLPSFGVIQFDLITSMILDSGTLAGGTATTSFTAPSLPGLLGLRVPGQYLVAELVGAGLSGEFSPIFSLGF